MGARVVAGYTGELAGLTTALLWTFGSLLFAQAGVRIGARAVNEIRLALASVAVLALHWTLRGSLYPSDIPGNQLGWLALSGVAGLALGDLFYFHAIVVLGPRIGTLLMSFAPGITVVLAWIVLDEVLGWLTVAGILVTLGGIIVVILDPAAKQEWRSDHGVAARRVAVAAGLLGALGQACGNVFSKLGGMRLAGAIPVDAFATIVVRLTSATAAVLLIALVARRLRLVARGFANREARRRILLAVVFGPTVGVWLYQVSIYRTNAAIAAILAALVPVFMIPVARVIYGARPSRPAVAGTLAAVLGTALLFVRA